MAFDEMLADRLRAQLGTTAGVTERRMFGGLVFFVGGNMACGVIHDDLCLRLDPRDWEAALDEPGARVMDFTGRPMKGWVYVAPDGLRDDGVLRGWVERGVARAQALPAKGAGARRSARKPRSGPES